MSRGVECHFSKRSFAKHEPCADLGLILKNKQGLFFAIADVAGHGDAAHRLSLKIRKYFVNNHKDDLIDLMSNLHIFLKGSRGAVAAAGSLDRKTGAIEYVGLGNITARKIGKKDTRFISNEGVIGYVIPTPTIRRFRLGAGDVFLLHTDGIHDHFQARDCPKYFFDQDAKRIANGIVKYFHRGDDDAGCIAIRYKNG